MQIQFENLEIGWVCLCGNTCDQNGFYTCNREGRKVVIEDGAEKLYVCDRCGRIIDQTTLEVVGVRADNSLTEEEKSAIYNDLT
jgi:transcription initiation factor IIE alpha subunit